MAIETIVAAIVGAVSAGATETGKKVVGDAYDGLKSVIKRKFGAESEASTALERLEAKPDSEARRAGLKEELEAVGAGGETDVVAAAEGLLAKLRELPGAIQGSQYAHGDGNIQVIGHGVKIGVGASGGGKADG